MIQDFEQFIKMAECRVFPVYRADDICFYITHVVMSPIVFGVGVLGNLTCIVVLNTRFIRKANPTYAYINGLAIVDILYLLLLIPRYLQESGTLPMEISHCRIMAHAVNITNGATEIFTHCGPWFVLMAAVVFLAGAETKSYKNHKPAWLKISVSRIIAFVIFLASVLLNFPRFFESSVKEVKNHCLEGLVKLWGFEPTSLGQNLLYTDLYPWIVTGLSFFLPYSILIILAITIPVKLRIKQFCKTKVTVTNTLKFNGKRVLQLGKCLFVLIILFAILETPANVKSLLVALYGEEFKKSKGYEEFVLISELLHRIRASIPFLLYSLLDGAFRKSLRRILCCASDDFYEPCVCCVRSRLTERSDWVVEQKKTKSLKKGHLFRPKKSRKGNDFSEWV